MMKTYATNDREYWTRKVRCAACGEASRHYEAFWDAGLAPEVFAVPYAALNGGIHHEIEVTTEWPEMMVELGIIDCTVYLSECCDYPHYRKKGITFHRKRATAHGKVKVL
jgi:hypothetical protein